MNIFEFAKSRTMRDCVPTWSTCQRAYLPVWFACQRACVPAWFKCQRACVPTCQKRAKFSFLSANVPKTCQRTIRRANVSTWHTNMPNGVPIFQLGMPMCQRACQFFKHSSYEMLREISILYYYIKISTIYLISYHVCMYRTYELYYTILFETFLLFR